MNNIVSKYFNYLVAVAFVLNSWAKKHVSIAEYQLMNSSEAKESLHVSLQTDDFYNPFLTRRENKDLKKFSTKEY